jgi:NAD(P)H-nitrite reductase large subunit
MKQNLVVIGNGMAGARAGVFVFRTLDDCREIAEYARGRGRAGVIGGGLLGLEAARVCKTSAWTSR